MKTKKSKEIFWSIISILVGGGAWLTMQNISWGVVDPAKVGLVFAVIGLISLIWALFDKNSIAHERTRLYVTPIGQRRIKKRQTGGALSESMKPLSCTSES